MAVVSESKILKVLIVVLKTSSRRWCWHEIFVFWLPGSDFNFLVFPGRPSNVVDTLLVEVIQFLRHSRHVIQLILLFCLDSILAQGCFKLPLCLLGHLLKTVDFNDCDSPDLTHRLDKGEHTPITNFGLTDVKFA